MEGSGAGLRPAGKLSPRARGFWGANVALHERIHLLSMHLQTLVSLLALLHLHPIAPTTFTAPPLGVLPTVNILYKVHLTLTVDLAIQCMPACTAVPDLLPVSGSLAKEPYGLRSNQGE